MMEDLPDQQSRLQLLCRNSVAEQGNPVGLVPVGSVYVSLAPRVPSQRLCRVARPVGPGLATSAITLISCAHGRQRREERDISKRELQEAIKYGRKERANPGRDGRPRWRFIHKGVVYITDETGRHEITSWRVEDAGEAPPPAPSGTCHTAASAAHVVVVVDHSGSMRKDDVPGYDSRTAAVYDCLARELVELQLKDGGAAGMEVSIIEMTHCATVLCKRLPMDEKLLDYLRGRKSARARSHGNYLPALDAAAELLEEDAARTNQLFLVFLSDGAPSDHTDMACPHGVLLWQPDPQGGVRANGRPRLRECHVDNGCRAALHRQVATACVDRVKRLGDLLGRDRVFVGTVAFGPPDEDYRVLRAMAEALPRSSFQKLGLSALHLRTAFTSLACTLATMCTVTAAGAGVSGAGGMGRCASDPLTLRSDIAETGVRKLYEDLTIVTNGDGWDLYVGDACVRKRRYLPWGRTWEAVPYVDTPHVRSLTNVYDNTLRGIAHAKCKFGEGAERVVFQSSEVVSTDGGKTGFCVGPRLVAKQTRYEEHVKKEDFHRDFCRTQAEAEDLAQLFNRRLAGGPQVQLRFLPCHVYTITHPVHGPMEVLAEEELEGTYTKWNNNGGAVRRSGLGAVQGAGGGHGGLGAIAEDGPEEEDAEELDGGTAAGDREEGEEAGGGWPRAGAKGGLVCDIDDVPQAFSHFTFEVTCGQKLVCDLQGVWNPTDGFTLTDPVIHHVAKRNGATDKGREGMARFFATHTCNALCRRLRLKPHPKQPDYTGGSRVV